AHSEDPARERRDGKGHRRDDAVIHGVGEERRAQARRLARAISALDREQRELEGEHEEQQQAEPERGKGSEKGRTQRDRRVGRLAAPPPGASLPNAASTGEPGMSLGRRKLSVIAPQSVITNSATLRPMYLMT